MNSVHACARPLPNRRVRPSPTSMVACQTPYILESVGFKIKIIGSRFALLGLPAVPFSAGQTCVGQTTRHGEHGLDAMLLVPTVGLQSIHLGLDCEAVVREVLRQPPERRQRRLPAIPKCRRPQGKRARYYLAAAAWLWLGGGAQSCEFPGEPLAAGRRLIASPASTLPALRPAADH